MDVRRRGKLPNLRGTRAIKKGSEPESPWTGEDREAARESAPAPPQGDGSRTAYAPTAVMRKRRDTQPAMNAAKRKKVDTAPTYEPVDPEPGGLEARVWIGGRWQPVGVVVMGPKGTRIRLGGPPPAATELIVAVRTRPDAQTIVQLRERIVETRRDGWGTILNLRHVEAHCSAGPKTLHRFLVDVLGVAKPADTGFRSEGSGAYYHLEGAEEGGPAPTDDFTSGGAPETAIRANPLAAFQRGR